MSDRRRHIGAAVRIGAATAVAAAGATVLVAAPTVFAQEYVVDATTTLADAVTAANANAGPDTITFDADFVATLPDGIDTIAVPTIEDDLVITGLGRDQLTLTNSDGPAALSVGNGADLTVSALTIENPREGGVPSVGILSDQAGTLRVQDVTVTGASDGVSFVSGSPGAAAVSMSDVDVADTTEFGITLAGASEVTLDDVTATASGAAGIVVFESLGTTTLTGVSVADSTQEGLNVAGSGPVVIDGLDVSRATAGADPNAGRVVLDQNVSVDADDVSVTGATGAGFDVQESSQTALANIDVSDSGIGVRLVDTGATTLATASLTGNADTGLLVDQISGPVDVGGLTASGNGYGVRTDNGTPAGAVAERGLTIHDSVLSSNQVGGIAVQARGDIVLDTVSIADNGTDTATSDGGVFVGFTSAPTNLTISDSTITGNTGGFGGGVSLDSTVTAVDVVRSTITGNVGGRASIASTTSSGESTNLTLTESVMGSTIGATPGLFAEESSITVNRSTIEGLGGSKVATTAVDGVIVISDSTVTGNDGASSLFDAGGGSIRIDRTTVADNTVSGAGAGLFARNGGTISANTSILTGNGAPLVAAGATGPTLDVDYSLIPVGTGAVGSANVAADDPLLGPLQDNGGPLRTMLPAEDSPVIDIGDPAIDATTTDERGYDRVVGDRADAGSVERQQSPFVISLPPARVLETRVGPTYQTIDDQFEGIGRRADGQELTLPIAGRAGVPDDARAVVVNITAVDPSSVGFVTVHPCEVNPPLASSLNFRVDVDSGNEIVAELNDEGALCLFNRSATDLVVDVVGYVPVQSRYRTVGPARLLDTRPEGLTIDGEFQKGGIRASDTELELEIAGRGGVSSDATAVVINVTAVKPVDIGYVTVHPCLDEEPTAASLNFEPGVNRGNEIIAQLDENGNVCLYTWGSAELVVDVVGQLSSENTYEPVAPARLVETRPVPTGSIDDLQEDLGRLDAREVLTVDAAGRAGVPADAKGVVVNVTAIRPDLRGFITVWDCTGTMPLAASLNFVTGEIVGNELVVDVNSSGDFCIFTNRSTDLAVDVVGYLT